MAANALAKTLRSLHVPSKPIVFANVWDVASFNNLASLNSGDAKPVKAVATASWAIAATYGIKDEELSREQNLEAVSKIAPFARKAGIPLSADLQDGYGGQIESTVSEVVKMGVVGANIEDSVPANGLGRGIEGSLYPVDEQVSRLKAALKAAADAGCQDFALNARSDIFVLEPSEGLDDETRLKEALKRGRAFLEAGATSVFYWGKIKPAQVEVLVKELDGKVAVLLGGGLAGLTTTDAAKLGVSRISVGPGVYRHAMSAARQAALSLLEGGSLPA